LVKYCCARVMDKKEDCTEILKKMHTPIKTS